MRYFKIKVGNGYCGCDSISYHKLSDNVSGEFLSQLVDELAYENAESYEHCHVGWDTSHLEEEELEEELADYYENHVEGYYKEITKEEYEDCH